MMHVPNVTVLMPVYNGEKYLNEAIQSILDQTYTDFEFLIINDGSTDRSVEIIRSFRDPRIRLVHNDDNLGLIATLNKGVQLAKGRYIARMDADDISLPERFAKEAEWLDSRPSVSVVSVKALLINANGSVHGEWLADRLTTTWSDICRRLPKENCIVHPGVMARKEILAKYGYDPKQKNVEDYDLWLRMASDGCRIEKIDEQLLKYRVHPDSVTILSKRTSPLKAVIHAKYTYLRNKIRSKQLNSFDLKILAYLIKDIFYTMLISLRIVNLSRNSK